MLTVSEAAEAVRAYWARPPLSGLLEECALNRVMVEVRHRLKPELWRDLARELGFPVGGLGEDRPALGHLEEWVRGGRRDALKLRRAA